MVKTRPAAIVHHDADPRNSGASQDGNPVNSPARVRLRTMRWINSEHPTESMQLLALLLCFHSDGSASRDEPDGPSSVVRIEHPGAATALEAEAS